MKLIISTLVSLLFTGAFLSAQMPGMMTMQKASAPQGTTLGANTTSGAAGIALGNRVVMRGFADFQFNYHTKTLKPDASTSITDKDGSDFKTAGDIDFLFDFSPVTGEIHLNATNSNSISASTMRTDPGAGLTSIYETNATTGNSVGLEQAFARYSFNRDFHVTFGRQLTSLAFEADEVTGLHTISHAYQTAGSSVHRGYNDGIRANFNNGRFGFILGLYDGYWTNDDFNADKVGIDIAASLMIVPGLEYRIGYAHNGTDNGGMSDNITQFNTWLSYNTGDLTLAIEYDKFDVQGSDIADVMLLASYQFSDFFAASLRYVYEDVELANVDTDRITLALLFDITQNFALNFEYSHQAVNANSDYSINEIILQGLLSF
jgi:hypothetical protein